jgi:hypothetical protein
MLEKNARIVASDAGHRVEITIRVSSRNGLTREEVAAACRDIVKPCLASIGAARYIDLDTVDSRIEF